LDQEISVLGRIIGAFVLVFLGSYLIAQGLSNLILLPLVIEFAGLSGAQAQAQVVILQNQIITQLAAGIVCLATSIFIGFFKVQTLNPPSQFSSPHVSSPQLSKASSLTTDELVSELKLRTPRN
jgi:hypothetical protein